MTRTLTCLLSILLFNSTQGFSQVIPLNPGPGVQPFNVPINPPPFNPNPYATVDQVPVQGAVNELSFYWLFALIESGGDIVQQTSSQNGTNGAAAGVTVAINGNLINIIGTTDAYIVGGASATKKVVNATTSGIASMQIHVYAPDSWEANLEAGSNANGIWDVQVDSNASFHLLTSILTANFTGVEIGTAGATGSSLARGVDNWANVATNGNGWTCLYYDFDEEGSNVQIVGAGFGDGVTIVNREYLVGTQTVGDSNGGIYMGGGWVGGGLWDTDWTSISSYSSSIGMKVDAH